MVTQLRIGDKVRVKDSMLYSGRVGVLKPNSGEYDDPWDFTVLLEATEVPKDINTSRIFMKIYEERTIGVHDFQVEPL
jgi:hypothetical protein